MTNTSPMTDFVQAMIPKRQSADRATAAANRRSVTLGISQWALVSMRANRFLGAKRSSVDGQMSAGGAVSKTRW
jgi:hypothetical protein